MKTLVIVESPTKAKTIGKFLGKNYLVESSFGHIRDLPKKELGIDPEHNFEPKYIVPETGKKQAEKLISLAKKSGQILFATDEDREGEAIAWHLAHILKSKNPERITFHEITPKAIENALKTPRGLDMNLVDAQQARRVLDRLVGYHLSPFLWKKVARGLSAGRVQSVAVRLIVEKEREIQAFNQEEYWTVEAEFTTNNETFPAKLHALDGKALKKMALNNKEKTDEIIKKAEKQNYQIAEIKQKLTTKKAPTPYSTSTLQQDANHKLGFSAKQTMRLAQQLYEGIDLKNGQGAVGLITYMRTDSLNLSVDFRKKAVNYIQKNFGDKYAYAKGRVFKTKSKGAQEAHEAIRPTHVEHSPESIKNCLNANQFKLYNLIWTRSLATQMSDAKINSTAVDITDQNTEYLFRATGQTIAFPGFLKVYKTDTKETLLPEMREKQPADLQKISGEQHFTQPPARYTEASLVKALEEHGIGRPSTYAPTISTIQDRNYVVKEEKKLKPTDIGITVNDILVEHFPEIVGYDFTAEMEENLDCIAHGKKKWQPVIRAFWQPFKTNLDKKDKELTKKDLTEEKTDEKCDKCGANMVIKIGRFGKFMACSNYPECKNTKPVPGSEESQEEQETIDEKCEKCGAPLVIKHGRFGKFYGCSNYPECKYIKSASQKTGVNCPECGGDIVSRKGKRGIFYGCSNYPKCRFTLFAKPTGNNCKICGALMVTKGKKGGEKCSNKDCETNK